jgi:hypothetical protein
METMVTETKAILALLKVRIQQFLLHGTTEVLLGMDGSSEIL